MNAAGCLMVAAGEPDSSVAEMADGHPDMMLTDPGDVEALVEAVFRLLER